MKYLCFALLNSLCCLLFVPTAVFAQAGKAHFASQDSSFKLKGYFNHVQFTPLKLLGWINPGIELGYERLYGSRWSTQVTATYLLPQPLLKKDRPGVAPDKKGFKIAAEEKFYVRKMARKGFYVSGVVAYMYSHNTAAMSFESITSNRFYRDTFELTKNNLYFNLNYGYYFTLKRIMITFTGGLGAQYRNAAHSGRIDPQDQFSVVPDMLLVSPNYYNRAGRSWEPYFPLTMRIGYLF